MDTDSELGRLMHAANNCRQMLHALDRKLVEARDCARRGEMERCVELLDFLTFAIPEAIEVISQNNGCGPDGSADGQPPGADETR